MFRLLWKKWEAADIQNAGTMIHSEVAVIDERVDAVVDAIREVLGIDFVDLGEVDPQIVGALGSALFARERWQKAQQRETGSAGGKTERKSVRA